MSPKLDKTSAKALDKVEAAGSGFPVVPEGDYYANLFSVEVREGPSGEYWSWCFQILGDQHPEYDGRRFWTNTSRSEASKPFFKRMFDVFNVPTDTDTDDLLGEPVKLHVKEIIVRAGAHEGEPGNEIALVSPYDGPERKKGDNFPF
jgi:hypothetical protein